MGKAADKKLKRRRAAAVQQRRSNRNEKTVLESIAESAARQAEALAAAGEADRKAAEARRSEVIDAMTAHPVTAIAAVGFTRALARMADGTRRTDGETVFPRMSADVARMAAHVMAEPHTLCEHLDAVPEPVAFRCVMCPDDLLMCMECLRTHGSTHPVVEEYRCSECLQVYRPGLHNVRPDPLTGPPVKRTGDDLSRIAPFAVCLSGYGICPSCRSAAGKARSRQTVVPQQNREADR